MFILRTGILQLLTLTTSGIISSYLNSNDEGMTRYDTIYFIDSVGKFVLDSDGAHINTFAADEIE